MGPRKRLRSVWGTAPGPFIEHKGFWSTCQQYFKNQKVLNCCKLLQNDSNNSPHTFKINALTRRRWIEILPGNTRHHAKLGERNGRSLKGGVWLGVSLHAGGGSACHRTNKQYQESSHYTGYILYVWIKTASSLGSSQLFSFGSGLAKCFLISDQLRY